MPSYPTLHLHIHPYINNARINNIHLERDATALPPTTTTPLNAPRHIVCVAIALLSLLLPSTIMDFIISDTSALCVLCRMLVFFCECVQKPQTRYNMWPHAAKRASHNIIIIHVRIAERQTATCGAWRAHVHIDAFSINLNNICTYVHNTYVYTTYTTSQAGAHAPHKYNAMRCAAAAVGPITCTHLCQHWTRARLTSEAIAWVNYLYTMRCVCYVYYKYVWVCVRLHAVHIIQHVVHMNVLYIYDWSAQRAKSRPHNTVWMCACLYGWTSASPREYVTTCVLFFVNTFIQSLYTCLACICIAIDCVRASRSARAIQARGQK